MARADALGQRKNSAADTEDGRRALRMEGRAYEADQKRAKPCNGHRIRARHGRTGLRTEPKARPGAEHRTRSPVCTAEGRGRAAGHRCALARRVRGGHIPGALNIPFEEIAERIVEVDTPNGVALYCMVGPRARKGEAALHSSGYTKILHIQGGLSAWKQRGLPVETRP